jgi:hypothetical protein
MVSVIEGKKDAKSLDTVTDLLSHSNSLQAYPRISKAG